MKSKEGCEASMAADRVPYCTRAFLMLVTPVIWTPLLEEEVTPATTLLLEKAHVPAVLVDCH